jgi:oxaloacetate decarboxylase alpha subunit
MLPDLRERHPDESIELLLLRAMFAGTQVDEMKRTVAAGGNSDEVPRPLLDLIRTLYQKSETGTQTLKAGDLRISLKKGVSEDAA